MTKSELIEILEKKILLLQGFKTGLSGNYKSFVKVVDNQIEDFRWTIEEIKNLNGATVKREKECDNPHCIDGVVGESYGEKIYCSICNPHF